MARGAWIPVFLPILLLCACSRQGPAPAQSSQFPPDAAVCTTVSWEVGMEMLEEEQIQEIGRDCDSFMHFQTTKDRFLPEFLQWLGKYGYTVEESREMGVNNRYENPRKGYLELNSSISYVVKSSHGYVRSASISYDTYSGQLHSIYVSELDLSQCYEMLALLTEMEGELRENEDALLDVDELDTLLHSPIAEKELAWNIVYRAEIQGYSIDFSSRNEGETFGISVCPSFDQDKGRFITREEAEGTGKSCSVSEHFSVPVEEALSWLQPQVEKMGYEIGAKTEQSYNYIYTVKPVENGAPAEEQTCYASRQFWNLEAQGDNACWIEAAYDTGSKKIHNLSAALGAKDECYELIKALFDREAVAAEDPALIKTPEEWKREGDLYHFGEEMSSMICVYGNEKRYIISALKQSRKDKVYYHIYIYVG